MTGNEVGTVSAARRRIQILLAAVVVASGGYWAAWTYAARTLDKETELFVTTAEDAAIACPDRTVGGFPFRIGVSCASVTVEDKAGAYRIEAGALRTTAVVYNPRHVIASLDGPATIAVPAGTSFADLAWERARGSFVTAPADDQLAAITFETLAATFETGGRINFDSLDLFARPAGTDADFALRAGGIRLDPVLAGGRDIVPFGLDLDLRLTDTETAWFSGEPGARAGIVNRAGFVVDDDSGITAEGPFSIGADGLVTARLEIRVIDVDAVTGWLRQAFPEQAATFEAMAAARPRGEGPADEWRLTVDIAEGQARLGFIPLGRVPPVLF